MQNHSYENDFDLHENETAFIREVSHLDSFLNRGTRKTYSILYKISLFYLTWYRGIASGFLYWGDIPSLKTLSSHNTKKTYLVKFFKIISRSFHVLLNWRKHYYDQVLLFENNNTKILKDRIRNMCEREARCCLTTFQF